MTLDVALDMLVKATLLFTAGWVVTALMWRASAASRHAVWAAVCVAALALPLAQSSLPTFSASWWPQWSSASRAPVRPDAPVESVNVTHAAAAADAVDGDASGAVDVPWGPITFGLWVLGLCVGLTRLIVGRRAAHALTTAAVPETAARILARADLIGGWLGAPPCAIRRGAPDWMPATWGVRRPVVVLPSTAVEWSDERLDPVLVHELAHVYRRDAVWHQVAQVMVAVWWMHPLAWIAARQLRVERERACDDLVLAFGARASDYATDLVSLVGVCGGTEMTLAMARRSQLEGRVMAILNPRLNRNGRTGLATLIAAAVVVAMAPLASMRAATVTPEAPAASAPQQYPQNMVRVGSTILEPKKIKDVRPVYPPIAIAGKVQGVVIAEIVIDTEGVVTDAKVLRPVALLDQAALEAIRQWRFMPTELNGVRVPIVMTVTVAFRLDENGNPINAVPPQRPEMTPSERAAYLKGLAEGQAQLEVLEAERAASVLANLPLPTWTEGDPPLRIGGHIKEPKKIKDVRPVYPDIALSARVQGIVIIEAQIDQDGKVNNARVIRPVALLDQAALDAVLQWEFEPVLLNGQPVPVIMTVTVNFTLPGL